MLLLQGNVTSLDTCSVIAILADSKVLLLSSTAAAACMSSAQQAIY